MNYPIYKLYLRISLVNMQGAPYNSVTYVHENNKYGYAVGIQVSIYFILYHIAPDSMYIKTKDIPMYFCLWVFICISV